MFGVPVSKSTQLLQAAAAEASLNKSKSASTTPSGSPCSSQQSVYHPGEVDASSALTVPNTQPAWNPFGDDNFSKLTAEELLNKDFAKLAETAAAGEKAAGSNENLIPSLNAFPAMAEVCVDSLIPGLEAPQPQRHLGQPELIPASVPDSLTGEDSLLGCDLLSHTCHGNPSVSVLPSSCSSAPPGAGSCLEELPAGQTASDLQGESNGYSVLEEGQETEAVGADSPQNEGCVHSSDEDEEKEAHKDEQEDGEGIESHIAPHDCSGSRPLLQDSEDEEDQGPQLALHPSLHSGTAAAAQPAATFDQPAPNTFAQNHFQHVQEAAKETEGTADIFSKAPFRIAQEDTSDVFANAPFPRGPLAAQQQQQLDVFSQAPFGKRNQPKGAQPKTSYPHAAGAHAVTSDQGVLGQVAQQPFRPQALAKYSRHFEGPVPQQPAAAHKAVSNASKQAAVASVPAEPLHSWTSDVSAVDPFVSAPFHLKAPQEKPWTHTHRSGQGESAPTKICKV